MNIHTHTYNRIYSMRHTFLHLTPFISQTSRHPSQRDMTHTDNEATVLCGPLAFPHLSRPWQYLHGGTLTPLAGIFVFLNLVCTFLVFYFQFFHRICVC